MNKGRLVIVVLVTVAAIVFLRKWQQGAGGVDEATLAAEDKSWQSVPTVERVFQEPPASWDRASESSAGITLAAPCTLTRKLEKQDGIDVIVFQCQTTGITYLAMIHVSEKTRDPIWIRAYWSGHDESMLREIRKTAPAAAMTPVARVTYAGHSGREESIDMGTFALRVRELTTPQAAITMGVVGAKDGFPEDAQRFFDSLKTTSAKASLTNGG